MADHPDYGSPNASIGKDRLSLGGSDATAFLGGAALGVLFGGAVGYFLLRLAGGDEPPIRVKGGSMEFELLGHSAKWKQTGSGGGRKKWQPEHGKRAQTMYEVLLAVRVAGKCESFTWYGSTVTVTYSDGTEVIFTVDQEVTTADASDKVKRNDSDKRVLEYDPGDGYIKTIVVKGNPTVSLDAGDKIEHMLLLDY